MLSQKMYSGIIFLFSTLLYYTQHIPLIMHAVKQTWRFPLKLPTSVLKVPSYFALFTHVALGLFSHTHEYLSRTLKV